MPALAGVGPIEQDGTVVAFESDQSMPLASARTVKMKFKLGVVLAGVGVIVLGCIVYSKRLQLSAVAWHWKNGDIVRVDNYEVPVPRGWLVRVEPSGLTSLIDTQPGKDANVNVIIILTVPQPGNFEFWKSYERRSLTEHGFGTIEERSLSFDSEAVECLGGSELSDVKNASSFISVECWSSGHLRLIFSGKKQGLDVLYSIVPKIRQVSGRG